MDELPQDRRGRILFGLKMSVAYSTVPTLCTSRREENRRPSFLFVSNRFRPAERVGPHEEIQDSGRKFIQRWAG